MPTDEEKEAAHDARERELAAKLTPEMIPVLVEAMRVCGWCYDLGEIRDFVSWLGEMAGVEVPRMEDLHVYP